MPRVKRGTKARARRKKVLKQAKGYRGASSRLYRTATEAVDKAGLYAYRDRRTRKRSFRALWITRISAAAKQCETNYRDLIHGLALANVNLDRKVLAELAVKDPDTFRALAEVAIHAKRSAA